MGIFGGGVPERVLLQAEALLEKNKVPEAARLVAEKIDDPRTLPEDLRFRCAKILAVAGDLASALDLAVGAMASSRKSALTQEVRGFIEQNLARFDDPAAALEACWLSYVRAGDWEEARKLVRRSVDKVPQAFPAFRNLAEGRAATPSMSAQGHAALAHISIAEGNAREATLHLRPALYGTPDLAEHAKFVLGRISKAIPADPETKWALLEAGHLEGDGWIASCLELAGREPQRLIDYLRKAGRESSPPAEESRRRVAEAVVLKYPNLPEAWVLMAELHAGQPEAEIDALTQVIRLCTTPEAKEGAALRIGQISEERASDLTLRFLRARALFFLPDPGPALDVFAPLCRIDPAGSLELLSEIRGAQVELPDRVLLLEAECLHATGNAAAAAERVRAAAAEPFEKRAEVLLALRTESPSSPDLSLALAEVHLEKGDVTAAEGVLNRLLDISPAAARATHDWLDSDIAQLFVGTDAALALRARAELLSGKEAEATERIAELFAKRDARSRRLLTAAARLRVAGVDEPDLDLEILRLLAEAGIEPSMSLALAVRLLGAGEAERALRAISETVPHDDQTERGWLTVGGRLFVACGRVREAVAVARSAKEPGRRLEILDTVLDEVGVDDRWMPIEGQIEVLIESNGPPERIISLLTRLLDEHADRTEAVRTFLDRLPESTPIRSRHLLLRGRCEDFLAHRNQAAELYLSAAEVAAPEGRTEILSECATRLKDMVSVMPDHDDARICLSRVEKLRGVAEDALAPIRDVPAPSSRLLGRLDEIEAEFPGFADVPWTTIEWLQEMRSHREAIHRLARLLEVPGADRTRIRRHAERAYDESEMLDALFLAADVDFAEGDVGKELETCRRILGAHPGSYERIQGRTSTLARRYPRQAEPYVASMEFAAGRSDLDGLVEMGRRALRANLEGDGGIRVTESFAKAGGFPAAANSEAYWGLLADHGLKVGEADRVVEACAKLAAVAGDKDRTVEARLNLLYERGTLPLAGVELLLDRYREFSEPVDLARVIRWRLDRGADRTVMLGMEKTGEGLIEKGAEAPELRLALVELAIRLGNPVDALRHLVKKQGDIGRERVLAEMRRLQEGFPGEARVPVDRAVDVLAPAGRATEVALDLEKAMALDPDLAVARGLDCARGLLPSYGADPDLRRVLVRMHIHTGEGDEGLIHLNALAAAGDRFRDQALGIFPDFLARFPTFTEARIRWAEVAADAALTSDDAAGRWEACAEHCGEVISRSPEAAEELRTVKLCATALEELRRFGEAHTALALSAEAHPEECELPMRLRGNLMLEMMALSRSTEDARTRAAALLRVRPPAEGLAALPPADPADAETTAVRVWAHFAAGNYEQAVAEGRPLLAEVPFDGELGPPTTEFLFFVGRSLLALGREGDGTRYMERLARSDPGYRSVRAFLEERYRRRDAGVHPTPLLTATLEEVSSDGQA